MVSLALTARERSGWIGRLHADTERAPMKYAFWNNKGGVGKTFLCFATASEYARQHPQVKVVVMDMCPQANISEILLGGNGSGGEALQGLLMKLPVAQTIEGLPGTISRIDPGTGRAVVTGPIPGPPPG